MKASKNAEFPVMENNIGNVERGVSAAVGSYLLYKGLKHKGIFKSLLGGYLLFRGATGYCPTAQYFGRTKVIKPHNVNVKVSLTVNKPRSEVYQFWRKLENLPLFMQHLREVVQLDEKISVWKAATPGDMAELEWRSEIVEDQKDERIGWRSLEGSDISNAGNVHFEDAGKFGTEVHVVISYRPSGGPAGEDFGKLLNPAVEAMVKEDIRNFRRYIETGQGSPS